MKQNDDLKKFFEEAKQKTQKLERDKVSGAGIDPSEEQTLRDRLYRMIQYAIGRHDWYDNQRHRFLQIGLALMAAGVALGPGFASLAHRLHDVTKILSWIFGIIIFGTGFYLVYLYNKGIERNHPYRKIADIRSWYFVYNFPSGLSDHLSNRPDIAKREVNEVIDGLQVFLIRWLELTNDRLAFLKEDLEQVFILQLLQRYRSQQVKAMSRWLCRGLGVTAFFLVLVFGSFLCLGLPAADMPNQGDRANQVDSSANRSAADTTARKPSQAPEQRPPSSADSGSGDGSAVEEQPSISEEPKESGKGVGDTGVLHKMGNESGPTHK